jgi:predicted O-linked N-acetylglucosamine transferase (SPINDLY family)
MWHYNSLALVYKKLKMYEESANASNHAIQLNPTKYEYFYNLGNLYLENKKFYKALDFYTKAIRLSENYYDVYNNLGNVHRHLKNFDAASLCYKKSIELNSSCADSYFNSGISHMECKSYLKAIEDFERALKINPNFEFLLGTLLYARMSISDWKNFDENLSSLIDKISQNRLVSTPFPLLALTDSLELHKKATIGWSDYHNYSIKKPASIFQKDVDKKITKKIKIGYFSADFYSHPVNFLAIELFEKHNREKFETIAFSFTSYVEDDMHKRAARAFDKFIDAQDMSDEELVKIARSLDLDIAVDLGGYTTDSRASIFSFRIAPIQIGYLGYPGMLGGLTDYIIADEVVIPKSCQHLYTEKVAYIPNYLVNSGRDVSNKTFSKEELGLPSQGFIFCSFNNNHKILPSIFHCWMRILHAVEGSILWLGGISRESQENLIAEATSSGILSDRIVFADRMALREDHLARLKIADLFLDTFPYGAHTTASDALWVGLPLLTLAGQSFASRIGASLLNAIDVPELITNTQQDYENRAITLAKNAEELAYVRKRLKENRHSTDIFNIDNFVQNIEANYIELYKNTSNVLLEKVIK